MEQTSHKDISHSQQKTVNVMPLGSAGRVNRNMYVYEYRPDGKTIQDIIIVDCGVEFPDDDQLGVDLIIPDVTYLQDKLEKIRGIVVTHAHEDHFGALPYILKEIQSPPIYAAKLVIGFIRNRLEQRTGFQQQSFHEISPEDDKIELGAFSIVPFRVNHSVPDTMGLFIKTPVGNLVHAADFKFDWTPVDGKQFEVEKLAKLASEGVLLLASDSLGSTTEGYTKSEIIIQDTFNYEFERSKGQVFVTTISSNISRMQQAIQASMKYARKVVLVGRSIQQNAHVAERLGYLTIPEGVLVEPRDARNLKPHQVTYIIAGCYAQRGSGLDRVSRGEHREITLEEDATVIFSADPIPGVFDTVGSLIDRLTELGARVVYSEIQDSLHVSGHGARGDLSLMIGLTKPEYFLPIGGESRHQRAYSLMVEQMGYRRDHVFELRPGETLVARKDGVSRGEEIDVKDVFVDGSLVGDVGNIVLRDRQVLSENGIVVVIVRKGAKGMLLADVDIVSRGFVYMADSEELIAEVLGIVKGEVNGHHVKQWSKVKEGIERSVGKYLFKSTGRKPMIVAFLVNLRSSGKSKKKS